MCETFFDFFSLFTNEKILTLNLQESTNIHCTWITIVKSSKKMTVSCSSNIPCSWWSIILKNWSPKNYGSMLWKYNHHHAYHHHHYGANHNDNHHHHYGHRLLSFFGNSPMCFINEWNSFEEITKKIFPHKMLIESSRTKLELRKKCLTITH